MAAKTLSSAIVSRDYRKVSGNCVYLGSCGCNQSMYFYGDSLPVNCCIRALLSLSCTSSGCGMVMLESAPNVPARDGTEPASPYDKSCGVAEEFDLSFPRKMVQNWSIMELFVTVILEIVCCDGHPYTPMLFWVKTMTYRIGSIPVYAGMRKFHFFSSIRRTPAQICFRRTPMRSR